GWFLRLPFGFRFTAAAPARCRLHFWADIFRSSSWVFLLAGVIRTEPAHGFAAFWVAGEGPRKTRRTRTLEGALCAMARTWYVEILPPARNTVACRGLTAGGAGCPAATMRLGLSAF